MQAEGMAWVGERHRRPFLDYRAYVGLAAGIPFVILLTSRLGDRLPTVGNFAGGALATAVCTLLVGGLLHLVVNAGARRLAPVAHSRFVFYGALFVLTLLTVVGAMAVLLPQLAPLCTAIEGHNRVLTMQAVAISAAYVTVARAVALVSERAERQAAIAQKSEVRALKARIEALKSRMNPHFLFNALNSVASLIPEEPKLAESTVERLASVLRYTLLASQREFVSLGEELATVRDYLDIEEARFEGRIQTKIDVSPELYDRDIPPLLLQPLVENAVLHGLSPSGSGKIVVSGRAEEDVTVLTVSDDGVGPGRSPHQGNQIALSHLRERLTLTYGDASAVAFREAVGGGFECELRIPVKR